MENNIETIEIANLAVALVPVAFVIGILFRWSIGGGSAVYAASRMLLQLLLVGFVLAYVFESNSVVLMLSVLTFMLGVASWIALGPLGKGRWQNYTKALLAIAIGGISTLLLVTQAVLKLDPWFAPRTLIPLAGMIFASGMNSVSLAAERFQAELERGEGFVTARDAAMRASMIPLTNALMAVGLVSLPGLMTGQILSGVSPLIAARYQIMVMCMVFGAGGISSASYLALCRPPDSAAAKGDCQV